jgi:hypothetical protein
MIAGSCAPDALENLPERYGLWKTCRERLRRWTCDGSRGGRRPGFDKEICRQPRVVERCFNRLRQRRALATRYAERAAHRCCSDLAPTIGGGGLGGGPFTPSLRRPACSRSTTGISRAASVVVLAWPRA